MSWWNIETYLSLRELVLTNPAFLFSFIIYLRLWEVFWVNQRERLRYTEVYLLLTVCFIYCVAYQALSIRWSIMGFDNVIPFFDTVSWSALELGTQIVHFLFLTVIKGIISIHIPTSERSGDV